MENYKVLDEVYEHEEFGLIVPTVKGERGDEERYKFTEFAQLSTLQWTGGHWFFESVICEDTTLSSAERIGTLSELMTNGIYRPNSNYRLNNEVKEEL